MNTKAEKQELVLKHMGLAYKIAWEYRGRGIEQEELQAAAFYGLVKAASGFDQSRETVFPAFASTVIRNTIRMEFRRLRKEQKYIFMETGTGRAEENGKSCTWEDKIFCREPGFDRVEQEDFLSSFLSLAELTGKERKAVRLVICNGMMQKEAGKQIGLSQPHVSRRVRSGMKKIRKKYMEVMTSAETDNGRPLKTGTA